MSLQDLSEDAGPSTPTAPEQERQHMFEGLPTVISERRRSAAARRRRSDGQRFLEEGALGGEAAGSSGTSVYEHQRILPFPAPHYTSISDTEWDRMDMMHPLDSLLDIPPGQCRAWRPGESPHNCVRSILSLLADGLEVDAMMEWDARRRENKRMAAGEAFRRPPISRTAAVGTSPNPNGGCMRLRLDRMEEVRALGRGLKPAYYSQGRLYGLIELAVLPNNKHHVQMGAHRFVCWAFHGPPHIPSNVCMHLCGDRSCLNPCHLKWGSQKENILHSHPGGIPRDVSGRFSSSGGGASHVPSDDEDEGEEGNNNNNNS